MAVPRRAQGTGQDDHEQPLQENPDPKPGEDNEGAPREPLRAPGRQPPNCHPHAAHTSAPVATRIESRRP